MADVCIGWAGLAIAEDDREEFDFSFDSKLASCKFAKEFKFDCKLRDGSCVAILDALNINSSS